jgi:esterase/lipase
LRAIIGRYLSGAERIAAVEVHTGLGPFGKAEIILNEAHNSPACRRARAWWGGLVKSTRAADSVSVDINGSLKLALPAMLPGVEVTAVSLEFGTYPARTALRALRAENWLHHHGGAEHPDGLKIKADLREAFYPAGDEWRVPVWMQGREIIGQSLVGLSRDGTTVTKNFLPGAEPLYHQGDGRGLLLLHGGGGGTAWDMKEFASAAHKRGHTVWVPSLPGYGTQPSDLIGITAEAWLDEAREGVDRLLRECSTVAVVGHSVGGALALILSAEDQRISRVVAWAPPWKIRNRLLPLLPIISRVPLARRIIPERLPVKTPAQLREMGWVGYEWLPGSIGFPVLDVVDRLHEGVGDITCPVLLVQGTDDEVIDKNSARRIFMRLPGQDKVIRLIDGGSHVLMQGSAKDDLFKETLDFVE